MSDEPPRSGARSPEELLRWIGRGLGLLAVLFVLVFWIGEGMRPWALDLPDAVAMAVLFCGLAGHLVAWRHERSGAAMAVIAWLAFAGLNYVRSGRLPGVAFVLLLVVPAIPIYTAAMLATRRRTG